MYVVPDAFVSQKRDQIPRISVVGHQGGLQEQAA